MATRTYTVIITTVITTNKIVQNHYSTSQFQKSKR